MPPPEVRLLTQIFVLPLASVKCVYVKAMFPPVGKVARISSPLYPDCPDGDPQAGFPELESRLTGHVTGLDACFLREAADYDNPEYVSITTQQLNYMLQEVKPEK